VAGRAGSGRGNAQAPAATRVPIAKSVALSAAAAKLAAASAAHEQRSSGRASSRLFCPSCPPRVPRRPARRLRHLSLRLSPPPGRATEPRQLGERAASTAPAASPPRPRCAGSRRETHRDPGEECDTQSRSAGPGATRPRTTRRDADSRGRGVSAHGSDFVARNQVVERYLSGRLPLKGATDFERFCHQNPELLDEIGLPERVNAGLRLLEASGKPEPWQQAAQPVWQKPQAILGLGAAVLLLAWRWPSSAPAAPPRVIASPLCRNRRPNGRSIRRPARARFASCRAARGIQHARDHHRRRQRAAGGLQDRRITLAASLVPRDHRSHRSGTRGRDHQPGEGFQRHLRIALNSSALGPGNYQLTIEGLSWRGDPSRTPGSRSALCASGSRTQRGERRLIHDAARGEPAAGGHQQRTAHDPSTQGRNSKA